MDLSPPAVLGLLGLPILLAGLALYLRRRWRERAVRRELDQIGKRLSLDDLQPQPEPPALDAERFAELYRLIARADLKVGAYLARRGHGEVDLDEKLEGAEQSLREIVAFGAEQWTMTGAEWRSTELIGLMALSEDLLAESAKDDESREGELDDARPDAIAPWGRLAETLQHLRARMRQDFNAAEGAATESGQELESGPVQENPEGYGSSQAERPR